MNMSQFATQIGRNRTTIYRAAKARGIDIDAIRGEDGELTNEGIAMLAALFDDTQPQHSTQPGDSTDSDTATVATRQPGRQYEALQRELDATRGELDAVKRENALLREALARAQLESDRWHEAATLFLPAATATPTATPTATAKPRKSFLERMRELRETITATVTQPATPTQPPMATDTPTPADSDDGDSDIPEPDSLEPDSWESGRSEPEAWE